MIPYVKVVKGQHMGGPIWHITDSGLAVGSGAFDIVKKFIAENRYDGYTLSIFDIESARTVEIECDVDDMPSIVFDIYHLEKATPMTFIGVNPASDSYVVGMRLVRGRVKLSSRYTYNDGQLVLVEETINK